jgi:hypothetical protein
MHLNVTLYVTLPVFFNLYVYQSEQKKYTSQNKRCINFTFFSAMHFLFAKNYDIFSSNSDFIIGRKAIWNTRNTF